MLLQFSASNFSLKYSSCCTRCHENYTCHQTTQFNTLPTRSQPETYPAVLKVLAILHDDIEVLLVLVLLQPVSLRLLDHPHQARLGN